jgi:pimeloyl-ACP methyl ester carboxylesterase
MRIDIGEGLHLNYQEDGVGIPLVFAGPPGRMMNPTNVHRFTSQCRVVVYDARGGGDSDWGDWYSYRQCADDLAALLKALGIDKAVVAGGSASGIQTLHFALRHPDMVLGIALDGTSSEVNFTAARNWRAAAERTLTIGRDAGHEIQGSVAFPGNEFKVGKRPPRAKETDPRADFALYYGLSDLYENPLTPHLKDIKCPSLILIGEQDKLVGVGGSVRMNKAIEGSELRIVPDAGHTVMATNPEVASREILGLVDKLK